MHKENNICLFVLRSEQTRGCWKSTTADRFISLANIFRSPVFRIQAVPATLFKSLVHQDGVHPRQYLYNNKLNKSTKAVQVKVEQGWLEGERLDLCTGGGQYSSFKGIPYAAPPLGTFRFKAPQPPLPWEGIRKATQHGPVSPQVDIISNESIPGKEDCLYLNVYTPNTKTDTAYPVMVFIHGGGYKSGSGNDHEYGPDFLIDHGVILVTINYRLDALGFLCLDNKEVPGNAGLKDQVAALKWVQKNIKVFGGDPNNVTIFGQSAGGASVAFHLLSSMSKGLYKRVISMSGVPTTEWSSSFESKRRAFVLGKQLGIYTSDSNELLEALQRVPEQQLINLNPCVNVTEETINIPGKMFCFAPVLEKYLGGQHFINEDPHDIIESRKVNEADIFVGYTNNELVLLVPLLESMINKFDKYPELFVPRSILNNCLPSKILEISEEIRNHYFDSKKPVNLDSMKELVSYMNESVMTYKTQSFLRHLPTMPGYKKYCYQFSCCSSINQLIQLGTKYGLTGAAHTDDLKYIFTLKPKINIDKNSQEYKMINETCTIFTNFAKYGNPTPDSSLGITWPEFDNTTNRYVDIGSKLREETFDTNVLEFWDYIYNKAK